MMNAKQEMLITDDGYPVFYRSIPVQDGGFIYEPVVKAFNIGPQKFEVISQTSPSLRSEIVEKQSPCGEGNQEDPWDFGETKIYSFDELGFSSYEEYWKAVKKAALAIG